MVWFSKLNQLLKYILRWQPCIADFGMMAPMYGHLGRDPNHGADAEYACVFGGRRMNRPEPDFGEFEFEREEYLSVNSRDPH